MGSLMLGIVNLELSSDKGILSTGLFMRSSPIFGEPLVSERHCGSGGGPIEAEQEGESPPFRGGKGQEFLTCEAR
jgi:hypothetical protein